MQASVLKEIEQLRTATVTELRTRYQEVFGEPSRSHHKEFLFRRIAWRLQALAEGDLSERARRRALELAADADLRVRAPLDFVPGEGPKVRRASARSTRGVRDPRLPQPGTLLTRQFGGKLVAAKVLEQGFEYDGRSYRSLSSIATEVTGTRWNGFAFFGLTDSHSLYAKRK